MNKYGLLLLSFILNTHSLFFFFLITGKVTTLNKEKIVGAQIVLTQNDSLVGMTLTDHKGTYRVEGLNNGKYQVGVDASGYLYLSQEINIYKETEADFILQEEIILSQDMEEVVVTAQRSDVVKTHAKGSIFYLSPRAQEARDVFSALLEIPQLNVDALNRTISMANGDNLLILVNGVPRKGALEGINPEDITSVEVMDTPSARYLSEGITNVLNIKTKKKISKYRLFNLNTQHNLEGYYGTGNAGYETGSSNYSLYLNGDCFYFNNNHANQHEEQYTSAMSKRYNGRAVTDYLSYNFTLGGDWVINDKNYLSYNISLRDIPTSAKVEGQGVIEEDAVSTDYDLLKQNKTSALVNVYNLYHRYKFDEQQQIENQLNFTYNRNDDRNSVKEWGNEYDYTKQTRHKMNHYKGNYLLDYQYDSEKHFLATGSQTYFEKTGLELPLLHSASFAHQRWKEYLYVDYTRLTTYANYQLSMGLDMIFNKIERKSNDYYRLKYSLSAVYVPIRPLTFKLWGRGYTLEPGVAYLNPYNTSADSLSIVQGNSSLTPAYRHNLGFSASWNKNGLYISSEVGYDHTSDVVSPTGYLNEKGIYVSTYENRNKEQSIYATGIFRYNLRNVGSIGYHIIYRRYFFHNAVHNTFSNRFNWNVRYKSLFMNGHIAFMPRTYTPVQRTKSSSESLETLGWNVSPSFSVMASLRYYTGAKRLESWTNQANYHSYYERMFDERKNMLLVGFRYNWKQGKHKERKNAKLKVNNERLELL